MAENEALFLKRLLATFAIEANEHWQAMSSQLLALEKKDAESPAVIETLFRQAHSLKGAARAVNRTDIEQLCQTLESRFAALKRGSTRLSPPLLDELSRLVDQIGQLLSRMTAEAVPEVPAAAFVVDSAPSAQETVRIATVKLGNLLTQSEELLALKFNAAHVLGELESLSRELSLRKKEAIKAGQTLRAWQRGAARRQGGQPGLLPRLARMLDQQELYLNSMEAGLTRLLQQAEQDRRAMSTMVDTLLEDVKQALMLPCSALLDLAPKLVRDLAQQAGKQVELRLEGASIELDRRILEQLKDPLIHLLRNAVDHGIEGPPQRQQRGKTLVGSIVISVTPHAGNKVELRISDDGGGLQLERVRQAAQRLGLLNSAEPDAAELQQLIFSSGLSTSPILTDLSGRGLGLAIVREKVEKLGGRIQVSSVAQQGTQFQILVPTTLATFRGLLLGVGPHTFIVPAAQVQQVLRLSPAQIHSVENRDSIEVAGRALAQVSLAAVLGLPPAPGAPLVLAVVLVHGGKRIAFAVDAIIADQEVLVKALSPPLLRVRHIAGATLLEGGRVVPILQVADLMQSAIQLGSAASRQQPAAVAQQVKSLLVAEDSVTSRALLQNILETAGFRVSTAVDGLDALSRLRADSFDLLVSDVEMPHLDGFALTGKIRQDPQLRELPVVLVTALDSLADRERGVDCGANAYIVKSGFDQGNLLDVIRSLL